MVNEPIQTSDGDLQLVTGRAEALVTRSRSTAYKLLLYGLLALVAGQFLLSGRVDPQVLAFVAFAYGADVALQLYYQWEDRR